MPDNKPALNEAAKAKITKAAQNMQRALDKVRKMKPELDAQDKKLEDLDQALDQ